MSWLVRVCATLGPLELDVDLCGDARPVALVGPNGAGKTTLLRLIAGAYRPQAGRIEVGGRVLFDAAAAVDLPPERRAVGYVPQGYGLFPHLGVADNVAFGLRARGHSGGRRAARLAAEQMLDELGCASLAGRRPTELSGGEQQRVALARALVVDPAILLLDEPLAALDASARRQLRRFLADHLRRRARPSIVVTHDARDVLALEAEACVLDAGRVVQRGTADQLRRAPANDFVAELFGG